MSSLSGVEIKRHTHAAADQLLTEIADLYEQVYTEPPYDGGPLFSRTRFLERTSRQQKAEGYLLLTAHVADSLVAFAFGFTFAPGRWWSGRTTPEPAADIVQTSKFAVIELVVHPAWRGLGLGRTLMTDLLAGQPEAYAMLLAEPRAVAREIYRRWGWRYVADVQPADDAPRMQALILPLSTG